MANEKKSKNNSGGQGGQKGMRNERGEFTSEGARHFGRLGGQASRGSRDEEGGEEQSRDDEGSDR